jgi:hypothetical protein
MFVEVNAANKTLNIQQELTYFNQSNDTLLILNDWNNNAYSDVNTPLARRFSDEFYRGFGRSTKRLLIPTNYSWERTAENPDLIKVKLREKLAPNKTSPYLYH